MMQVRSLRSRTCAALLALTLMSPMLSGCATGPDDNPATYAAPDENDPLEIVNRAVFGLNEGVDILLIRPTADIYRTIFPRPVRNAVRNFLRNLSSPILIANELLQGDWKGAEVATKRFLVNSTVGIGGLVDVAAQYDLRFEAEDFGQTLAVWGVPDGPYIVLPFLGPSNFRDTLGIVVDTLGDPVNQWSAATDREWVAYGRAGGTGIDTRSELIEPIDDLRRNSLDYYAALRSLYRQSRQQQIRDGQVEVEFPEFPEFPEFDTPPMSPVDNGGSPANSR